MSANVFLRFCVIHLMCCQLSYESSVNKNYGHVNETYSCSHMMTIQETLIILRENPCANIIDKQGHSVHKRSSADAGNIDIHALQTTVHDHRTMINYLINNSINASFVADAITNHHTKTGPFLSSWRDLIDIFTILLFCGILVYFCIWKTGFSLCDRLVSCCCQPIMDRAQQQQQHQISSLHRQPSVKKQQRHSKIPSQMSIASLEGEIARINHGYI